jgi:hypothetical protein
MVEKTKSLAVTASSKGLDFGKFVAFTEDYFKTNVSAYQKAIDLSITNMDHCIERLSDVRVLIDRMTANLNALTLQSENLTHDERDALLLQVDSEVLAIKTIFADNKWGNDEASAEAHRIFDLVLKSMTDYSATIGKLIAIVGRGN